MALIVEDGTGKSDAESYASVADFKTYCYKVGHGYVGNTDTEIEQALRRATRWLDARYGARFLGLWTFTAQRLEWPRAYVLYRDTSISSDVVPAQVVAATCEATVRELASPHSLSEDESATRVKRDRVGDVETEFIQSAMGVTLVVRIIDDLLFGLTKGRSMAYVGRAIRA